MQDVIVVGAGAWGLPAAAELARRGHRVTLVDKHGVGNRLSSSAGPTRLWRIGDPDPRRVRLALRSIAAMDRLAKRSGVRVYERRGLLWRDTDSLPRLLDAVRAEGVHHVEVLAAEVAEWIPELLPDCRDAVWLPDAGTVLAERSLRAQADLLERHEGRMLVGTAVVDVKTRPAEVRLEDGRRLSGDVVVLAPGAGAVELLPLVGISVSLRPFAEQVVTFGSRAVPAAYDRWPCLFDGPRGDRAGIYAMPTPGVGYKVGLDRPLRAVVPGDVDRDPDRARTLEIAAWARAALPRLSGDVVDEQVCTWTDSPDGLFVIERRDDVVVACGDAGEGFKFSALMGELLADLAEGRADPALADFGSQRLAGSPAEGEWMPTALG